MRSTLALLLLFGAVIGEKTCDLHIVPKDEPCSVDIKWKVHTDEQATATCLEYFPTTFVKGKMLDGVNAGKIKCTVQAAYQCKPQPVGVDENDVFIMYDKCYYFARREINGRNPHARGTISDFQELLTPGKPEDGRKLCKGGKLSVFYSYTHAKFAGMIANYVGINRLWIGITKDGKSIEEPDKIIHSQLWKVVEGDYWDKNMVTGDDVLKTFSDNKVPDNAKYYFMRTRNDEFNRRYQGSFERATEHIRASFACEYDAKFTGDQKWYCDKMGSLGIDAVYDEAGPTNKDQARCLYISANKYTWKGTHEDMKSMKGCVERPSIMHSAGMDDGTAKRDKYAFKSQKGKLRLAGHIVERTEHPLEIEKISESYLKLARALFVQDKCTGSADANRRKYLIQKWRYFDHHGKTQAASASKLYWNNDHPLNECSDFPGTSSTIGLKNGMLIDMPPEARAHVVCSLAFFQECELKKPCGPNVECKNEKTFIPNANPKLQGFFTCRCPGPTAAEQLAYNNVAGSLKSTNDKWLEQPYKTTVGSDGAITCTWNLPEFYCAWLRFYDGSKTYTGNLRKDETNIEWPKWITGADFSRSNRFTDADHNDKLDQIVVRTGCTATVRAAMFWTVYDTSGLEPNFDLMTNVGFGTHEVPNTFRKTLDGDYYLLAASNVQCFC